MKKTLISAIAIVLSLAFVFCGCTTNNGGTETTTSTTEVVSVNPGDDGYQKSFTFEVVDKDGNKKQTEILTNGKYVGKVLQELEYIKGEQGDYGIYIKEVDGIVADYDVDGTYWAFYVDGEMSMTGADQVEIVDGSVYSFRVETY
ncbi:MAG: DUF4430 domain-containing protein [Clostridia bacterium]|nr:DUF4430 domain-containing protein [Clostridia bacterium]